MENKRTLSNRLVTKYLMIIRNEENFAEKTTITFSYAKIILILVAVFVVLFGLSFYMATTVLREWFDPRHAEMMANRQLVGLSVKIDSLITEVDKKDRFSMGYRVKLLNGFYHASTPTSFVGTLTTNEDNFSLAFDLQNARLRTVQVPDGGSFVFSRNVGGAMDLGINYNYDDRFSIAFSVTDIGFITWKEEVDIDEATDVEFTYEGVDIADTDDLLTALEDSISDKFNVVEDLEESFTTLLPVRGNLTGSWHLTKNSQVVVAVMPRYVRGFLQMQYGAGITQQIGRNLRLNVSANKLPQQQVNIGAALAANLGPLQIYGGTDKILGYDVTQVRNFNYSFGINLMFGRGKVKKEKEYIPSTFRINGGEELRVRGKEKIYLIIKKQKHRKPVNDTSNN